MTWAILHSFNAQTHLFSLHALKVQATLLCQIVVQGELIKKQTNKPQNIKADCNFIWMQLKNKHLIFTCDIARFLDEGSMYECISECKAWFFFFHCTLPPLSKSERWFYFCCYFSSPQLPGCFVPVRTAYPTAAYLNSYLGSKSEICLSVRAIWFP